MIITASCGLEPGKVIKYRPIVDEALTLCKKVENADEAVRRIIVQRKDKHEETGLDKQKYYDYDELMTDEQELSECVPVESTHPLYILCKYDNMDILRTKILF